MVRRRKPKNCPWKQKTKPDPNSDIYMENSALLSSTVPYCCRYKIELSEDCDIGIGDYHGLNHMDYPHVFLSKGTQLIGFVDNDRNGFCYDQVVGDKKLTMFVPKKSTIIVEKM